MYDFLIVGAGLTGLTLAERLASDNRKKILLIDKRTYLGGQCYDCLNRAAHLIQLHGPHIFHTTHTKVWAYLSQFTEWYPYQHRVRSAVDGKLVPFPINVNTINQIFDAHYTPKTIEKFFQQVRVHIPHPHNAKEVITSQVGTKLYEKFFAIYTKKQWGIAAEKLDASITTRIPIRKDYTDLYFTDRYQGIPKPSYTEMFHAMVQHKNIHLLLGVAFEDLPTCIIYKKLIFTGTIDSYLHYTFGPLPYRSVRFEFETLPQEQFQPVAVINYPQTERFTRITEFKHFTFQPSASTTILREYPTNRGTPLYPILTPASKQVYQRYYQEAQRFKKVYFAGRLGTFQYLNMDAAVAAALVLYETIKKDRVNT